LPLTFNIESNEVWTMENLGSIVVPKDSYFLMGDNRDNAADSRFRGCIDKGKIIAKILTGQ
jgi:signal peptidase I